jgi:hypothetical protein
MPMVGIMGDAGIECYCMILKFIRLSNMIINYLTLYSFAVNSVWIGITLLLITVRVDTIAVRSSISTIGLIGEAFLISGLLYGILAIVETLLHRKISADNPVQSVFNIEFPRLILMGLLMIFTNYRLSLSVSLIMGIYAALFLVVNRFLPSLSRLFSILSNQQNVWKYYLKLMLGYLACVFLMTYPVLFLGTRLVIRQELTPGQMLLAWSTGIPALASQFRLLKTHLDTISHHS